MTAYVGTGYAEQSRLRCLLTGRDFPSDKVFAAHIFRHEWDDRRALVRLLIGLN
jgi:hypothetical protein